MALYGQSSQVYADIRKNRLYIVLKGTVTKEETERIYTDIRFSVADLRPGFDVITDMTEGKIGYLSGIPVFKKIANYLIANDVGVVVRISDDKSPISSQLRKIAGFFSGYKPVYVSSVDEAEAVLEKRKEQVVWTVQSG